MSGHTEWSKLREEMMARPGAAEALERARIESAEEIRLYELRHAEVVSASGPAGGLARPTLYGVSVAHTVDQEGRYDGLTLREALPSVVIEIVSAVDPVEVIVFGSVARGEETADSDLDLLVVLDSVDPSERRAVMRQVRGAIHTFVPVDIVIADVAEVESDRDEVGSAVYWPLREGETVHRRMARRVS